jgi:hypothetical protein
MTEPETPSPSTSPAASPAPGDAKRVAEAATGPSEAVAFRPGALAVMLRVLLGFSGLGLLVGFFLPWHVFSDQGTPRGLSGLALATGPDVFGTPAALMFLVPALGVLLAVSSFMGFRFAGQVAVGSAAALLGYALVVLGRMLVEVTALGLWLVAGTTLLSLVLGIFAWVEGRERNARKVMAAPRAPG